MATTALPQRTWLEQRMRCFYQLSGHHGSIVPATDVTLYKKCADGMLHEADAYRLLMADPHMRMCVPKYEQSLEKNGEWFIEIEDVSSHFDRESVAIMDVKMGTRTFLESEVSNQKLRPDLYTKMVKLDPDEPTAAENDQKAVTKLRYMQFRERASSSDSLGFRVEAIKLSTECTPRKDYQGAKSVESVGRVLAEFFAPAGTKVHAAIVDRLKTIRQNVERSEFFRTHEVIGSSLLFMYDRLGASSVWLIDFAKARPVDGTFLDHRVPWVLGNHEDGYLTGLDNLIDIVERMRFDPVKIKGEGSVVNVCGMNGLTQPLAVL